MPRLSHNDQQNHNVIMINIMQQNQLAKYEEEKMTTKAKYVASLTVMFELGFSLSTFSWPAMTDFDIKDETKL